jgi:CBS domain-containing protein
MKLKEIMKSDAHSISPETPTQAAAREMRDANVGFLPVCDDGGKVLGTITDRDITTRVVAEGKSPSTPVRDVMSREVIACRPDDELKDAESAMTRAQKSRLLITDDGGKLLGVISLSDLAKTEGADAGRTMRGVTQREAHAS